MSGNLVLEVMALGVVTRTIVEAVEAIDEKLLVRMVEQGVTHLAETSLAPERAKGLRITLKRFELILRFKRELAALEKMTPEEEKKDDEQRARRLVDCLLKMTGAGP